MDRSRRERSYTIGSHARGATLPITEQRTFLPSGRTKLYPVTPAKRIGVPQENHVSLRAVPIRSERIEKRVGDRFGDIVTLLGIREAAALTCLLNAEGASIRWNQGMPPTLPCSANGIDIRRANLASVDVRWAGQHTKRMLSTSDLAALRGTAVADIAVGCGASCYSPLIPAPTQSVLDLDVPPTLPGRVQAARLPFVQSIAEREEVSVIEKHVRVQRIESLLILNTIW